MAERILKWPGKRIDPRASPSATPSSSSNFALCRIHENGGKARLRFLFWQNTRVHSSARFDVLLPRNDRLGLAERKIGSVGWGEREVRIGSAFRLNVTTSSVLVVDTEILDFHSMLDFNLIGIWLRSNNDQRYFFKKNFFFKYRFRSVVYYSLMNQVRF